LEQSLSATRQLTASRVDPVFFAGGLLIATAEDNRVTIWDAGSGQRLQSLADGGQILTIAISPDNQLLAVGRGWPAAVTTERPGFGIPRPGKRSELPLRRVSKIVAIPLKP
jgi:hypothetical protein